MIATYVKKPVTVKACQQTGDNVKEIKKFVTPLAEYLEDENVIIIHTLEGDMKAEVNDYIIKGVKGEFYPCKPNIFEETYNIVEND